MLLLVPHDLLKPKEKSENVAGKPPKTRYPKLAKFMQLKNIHLVNCQ
jgi:hypothetical protein